MPHRRSRHLTDARRRSWRTLFQVIAAVLVAEGFDRYLDPTDENALVLVPLLAWVFAYAQNALEDHGVIPALLKAPASSGARPIPADAARFERRVLSGRQQ